MKLKIEASFSSARLEELKSMIARTNAVKDSVLEVKIESCVEKRSTATVRLRLEGDKHRVIAFKELVWKTAKQGTARVVD